MKRALTALMREVTGRRGYFPARALRQGSDDEARSYIEDICVPVETGRWASRDRRDDYRAAVGKVEVPVIADRWKMEDRMTHWTVVPGQNQSSATSRSDTIVG